MALNKNYYLGALLITVFLFSTILLISFLMDNSREEYINSEVSNIVKNLNQMQTFFLMSEIYGKDAVCLSYSEQLKDLDTQLWNLGLKIENYRAASEEFDKNPFYKEQKRVFNENEVFYMLILKKVQSECSINDSEKQVIIQFFYRNSDVCKKCDDQSFVLSDINEDLDDYIAIFSFDLDLNITSIDVLSKYYNVSSLPCVVIEDESFCGMRDKDFIVDKICSVNPSIPICVQKKILEKNLGVFTN